MSLHAAPHRAAALATVPASVVQQTTAHVHEYAPMLNTTANMLRAFFAPYNRKLYALIGRDLPW